MTQFTVTPDARLLSAVSYIQKGDRIIDVGTDHAYLPIYLVESGVASFALACDINQGPIDSARKNICEAGLGDRIATLKTDGLAGTEDFCPDDVLVFGMGGELIVRILSDAPWVKERRVRLILQPMSRVATLRRWLLDNGFEVIGESITHEGKYYQTVCALYTGSMTEPPYSDEELLLGRKNIEENAPLLRELILHEMGVLSAIIKGKAQSAHADDAEERALLEKLEKRWERMQ